MIPESLKEKRQEGNIRSTKSNEEGRGEQKMENAFEFQKLTPTNNMELGIYDSAMKYVFDNEDIKNIAISGSYGAGKSSMLESYEKQHPDKNFLHISLAHFEEQSEESGECGDGGAKRELPTSVLEGKIINQLIHQIDPKRITQTDFRIKKDIKGTDRKQIWMITSGVILFLICLAFLVFHKAWCDMVDGFALTRLQQVLFVTKKEEAELIAGIVILILSVVLIKWIITAQKERKLFRKLSFQGNEIEVFADGKDSESFFDRYLNEVLYLFENAEVDGIVFEDIDRYDNKCVFEKLREINFLLNQRVNTQTGRQKEISGKVIRFFYLLRDDIFVSRDRVKFFDFIIPVVPVLNASNAYDKFIEFFNRDGKLYLFETGFLKNVSLYIDDMRILMNIHNEFAVYYSELSKVSSGLNPTKLLAMIIYKNMYPKDFGELQVSQGYVYALFNSIEEARQLELDKLYKELDSYKEEQKKLAAEISKNIEDLNAIYFIVAEELSVEGKGEGSFSSRREFVRKIFNSKDVKTYNERYGRWESYDVAKDKEKMEKNPEYIERRKAIEKRGTGEIKRKIVQTQTKVDNIKNARLKDILNRENSKLIFELQHINSRKDFQGLIESTGFPLIKYLISHGYIDEQYPDYMSYFYENSMSRTDKAFLRGIIDKEKHAFDYKINNPKLVTEEIKLADFEEEEIFNVDLLDFLLLNRSLYKEQLRRFMRGLWNYEPVEFVVQYLKTGRKTAEFAEAFNRYWAGACAWILETDQFDDNSKKQYVVDTVCTLSEEVIGESNKEDRMTHFIEDSRDFLDVPDEKAVVLGAKLEELEIKFKYIDYKTANKSLFDRVYQKELYDLNLDMVEVILQYKYKIENPSNHRGHSLSLILSKAEEPLCQYIKKNLSTYLQNLFAMVQEINDDERTICFVLNNNNVPDEQKNKYIEILTASVCYLKDITNKDLWGALIEQRKLEKNFENALDYYFLSGSGLDTKLISFLNAFEDLALLEHKAFKQEYGEDAESRFVNSILACNELRNDIYEKILEESDGLIEDFQQEGLEESKVEILLQNGMIPMNAAQLQFMRKAYGNLCISYIVRNVAAYTGIMTKELFSSNELVQILGNAAVEDTYKLQLLKFETRPITFLGRNYNVPVKKFILQNNFNKNDLPYLVENYQTMEVELREEICQRAAENIEDVLALENRLTTPLCNKLLASAQISKENKLRLLTRQCRKGMARKSLRTALKKLSCDSLCELLDGKTEEAQVTNNDVYRSLLESLKNRGWILDFEMDTTHTHLKVYSRIRKKINLFQETYQ